MQSEQAATSRHVIRPDVNLFFQTLEQLKFPEGSIELEFSNLETRHYNEEAESEVSHFSYVTQNVLDLSNSLQAQTPGAEAWLSSLKSKLSAWKEDHYRIFIGVKNKSQAERLRLLLEKIEWSVAIAEPDQEVFRVLSRAAITNCSR